MKYGLEEHELNQLATFNGERLRGLVHTADYQAKMRLLQDRFDQAMVDWRPPEQTWLQRFTRKVTG